MKFSIVLTSDVCVLMFTYRQSPIFFPALAAVLWQFGLFEEDDGLFTVGHVREEEFLFRGTPLMLRGHT